jgi:hypothetical protein
METKLTSILRRTSFAKNPVNGGRPAKFKKLRIHGIFTR